ncbi:hypothetical protein BO71DRAFT_403796 [Aspergillus ellipticus CBS 707.79]|uniref:DUF7136 domain-containing protein n=1 Tax=Aspergillus ellipticus CBS 707.79 TaxID=1448320 RepID=A0A319EBL3_9EURO|nr:hypothetical protein BO71DRAFT_403796 [Aspergillus ellipticus CBS 707.79]
MTHVPLLAWTALIANLMVARGDAGYSGNIGIFEVDLIFPRNETYSPQALMPIVFALQNPTLAVTLGASISWNMWEGNNQTSPGSILGGELELVMTDTPFVTRFFNTIDYPDGLWTFTWNLQLYNCSQDEDNPANSNLVSVNNPSVFTVSPSGQAPNLTASTVPGTCGAIEAYAFNVTLSEDGCGYLGPTPSTNPCAVTVNPSAASSIAADATAWAYSPLETSAYPNVTCPTLPAKSSGDAGVSLIPATSTWLTLLVMVTALIYLGSPRYT